MCVRGRPRRTCGVHAWLLTAPGHLCACACAQVRSPNHKPGRYCQLEFGTHNFQNWLLHKMLDGVGEKYS